MSIRKKSMYLGIGLLIVCMIIASQAFSDGVNRGYQAIAEDADNIRKVDFKNFTYQSSFCYDNLKEEGLSNNITVSNGEFSMGNAYFHITTGNAFSKSPSQDIIYGDLTGDSREEAIVIAQCGWSGANFCHKEVFIYALKDGTVKLVTTIDDGKVMKDFKSSYPISGNSFTNTYWGIEKLNVIKGMLEVHALVDGCHACVHSTAIMTYKLQGKTLGLVGKPKKKMQTRRK